MKYLPQLNCSVPSFENYTEFINELQDALKPYSGMSFSFCYGSTARGSQVPGKSDIDAVFVFNENALTLENYKYLGEIIQSAHSQVCASRSNINPRVIPLQFSFFDTVIARDGRFLTYTPDFSHQFEEESIPLKGGGYDSEKFKMRSSKTHLETRVGFNLAKMRQKYVMSQTMFGDSEEDLISLNETFVNNYLRAISEVTNSFVNPNDKKTQRGSNSQVLKDKLRCDEVDFDFIEYLKEMSSSTQNWIELTKKLRNEECSKCLGELEKLVFWYLNLDTENYNGVEIPIGVDKKSIGLM